MLAIGLIGLKYPCNNTQRVIKRLRCRLEHHPYCGIYATTCKSHYSLPEHYLMRVMISIVNWSRKVTGTRIKFTRHLPTPTSNTVRKDKKITLQYGCAIKLGLAVSNCIYGTRVLGKQVLITSGTRKSYQTSVRILGLSVTRASCLRTILGSGLRNNNDGITNMIFGRSV